MKLVALSCRLSPPHSLFSNFCSVCSLPSASAIHRSLQVSALDICTLLSILFRLLLIRLPSKLTLQQLTQAALIKQRRKESLNFAEGTLFCAIAAYSLVKNQYFILCLHRLTWSINFLRRRFHRFLSTPLPPVLPKITILTTYVWINYLKCLATASLSKELNSSCSQSPSSSLHPLIHRVLLFYLTGSEAINGSGHGSRKCRFRS